MTDSISQSASSTHGASTDEAEETPRRALGFVLPSRDIWYGVIAIAIWLGLKDAYLFGLHWLMDVIQPRDTMALVVYFGMGLLMGSALVAAQVLVLLRLRSYWVVFLVTLGIGFFQVVEQYMAQILFDFRDGMRGHDHYELLCAMPGLIFSAQLPVYMLQIFYGTQLASDWYRAKALSFTIFQIMLLTAIAAFSLSTAMLNASSRDVFGLAVFAISIFGGSWLIYVLVPRVLMRANTARSLAVRVGVWYLLMPFLVLSVIVAVDYGFNGSTRIGWEAVGGIFVGWGALTAFVLPLAGLWKSGFRLVNIKKQPEIICELPEDEMIWGEPPKASSLS